VNAKRFVPSEQLRLNMSVPLTAEPNRLGVLAGDLQGFPNGRRLTDDVLDIEIQALEGAAQTGKIVDALAAGDKVDANDQQFSGTFPYVALPNGVGVNTGGDGVKPAANGSSSDGPALTPAGFAGKSDGDMPAAIAAAAVGVAASAGLGLLLLAWLWRRRVRLADQRTQRF
jgi:uncharacterized protein (TIGR03382 family)